MKENDVIYLAGDEKYLLIKGVMYKNDKYFLAVGLDEKSELIYNKSILFKQVIEGKETFVEEVEDKDLLDSLSKVFVELE